MVKELNMVTFYWESGSIEHESSILGFCGAHNDYIAGEYEQRHLGLNCRKDAWWFLLVLQKSLNIHIRK